jgi:hypothetical protein
MILLTWFARSEGGGTKQNMSWVSVQKSKMEEGGNRLHGDRRCRNEVGAIFSCSRSRDQGTIYGLLGEQRRTSLRDPQVAHGLTMTCTTFSKNTLGASRQSTQRTSHKMQAVAAKFKEGRWCGINETRRYVEAGRQQHRDLALRWRASL